MKKINLLLLSATFLLSLGSTAVAQTADSVTVEVKTKERRIQSTLGVSDKIENHKKYPFFFGGITFSRIDWGFSRLLDNGSFSLSDENEFLNYGRASNFGFDFLQLGLRVSDKSKFYLSSGIEWNYLRLKNNIRLTPNVKPLQYETIDEAVVKYKKNILTSTYLRIPFTYELRTAKNSRGERFKFALAAITGIRLKGTQRLKSNEEGKQKIKDDFNLAPFQYGGLLRLGYDDFGIFVKYYANDFFADSPNQKGLNNLTFGVTLGF